MPRRRSVSPHAKPVAEGQSSTFGVAYIGGVVDGCSGRLPVAVSTTLVWVALVDNRVCALPTYDDSERLLDKAQRWDVYTPIKGLPPSASDALVYVTARAEPLPGVSDAARLITAALRMEVEQAIQEAEGMHAPWDVLYAVLAGAGYPLDSLQRTSETTIQDGVRAGPDGSGGPPTEQM